MRGATGEVQASEGMKGRPAMASIRPVQTSRDRFLRVPVSLVTVRKRRAPFFVESEESQSRGGGDMAPRVAPVHAEAGLVDMHHRRDLQKLSGVVHKRGELLIEPLAGLQDRPFAHDRSKEIGADLAHPTQRDPLILVERGEIAQKS